MNAIQLLILEDTNAFIERLKEAGGVSTYEIADETPSSSYNDATIDDVNVRYKLVHSKGGFEGGGESVERVLEFKIGRQTTFVRVLGSYESYNGTEWDDDWKVVYPREVKVIQYFDTP